MFQAEGLTRVNAGPTATATLLNGVSLLSTRTALGLLCIQKHYLNVGDTHA